MMEVSRLAEQKSLSQVLKEINKRYTHSVATVGMEEQKENSFLSLRSPSLDYCLYNSLPERRIIEICGREGSGKTTCCYLIAASYQQKELARNPEHPRSILYADLEYTADVDWARKAGYDMRADALVPTIAYHPEDTTGEIILDDIKAMICTGEIGLVIIDSIPMLVGQQTYDKSFEQKDMGGIAKLLSDFVKKITSILYKYDCTLIGINQLRDNIGGYGLPYVTPGGNQWKFGCSVRLMLKRGAFYDADGNELNNNAESPAAYRMDMAVLKTKVCKWDRKVGSTVISYTDGVDILQDTIDVAIRLGLIDNSVQGWFKLVDPDTGEVLQDDAGNDIKIRGKKNLKPYFKEHKDLWKRLYDKVYELISKKNDPSIIAFEQMLQVENANKFDDINLNDTALEVL